MTEVEMLDELQAIRTKLKLALDLIEKEAENRKARAALIEAILTIKAHNAATTANSRLHGGQLSSGVHYNGIRVGLLQALDIIKGNLT